MVYVDETGWKVAGERAWLRVFSSATFACFAIDPRRGRAILERLYPGGHPGTVNSDRWSAYTFFSATRRQLCWSHMLRDLKGIVDAKDIRPAVLWRKGTQGARSQKGSLFVSRMLTVAATCRRQGHGLPDFLEHSVLAHQLGEQPPSLLTLAR